MARLRVCNLALSLDGFGAGPGQDLEHPIGQGGAALHAWAFATRAFNRMHGGEGGADGVDSEMIAAGFDNIGAWIIGRHMFGPDRGPLGPDPWRGWWGEEPPYHVPVFVLTHHPRDPLIMRGETVFHFVTNGIEAALVRARDAAGGKDVRLGGGVSVIRQYLAAGLVDDLHLALAPTLLGAGEPLFAGLDLPGLGYACRKTLAGEGATHLFIERTG